MQLLLRLSGNHPAGERERERQTSKRGRTFPLCDLAEKPSGCCYRATSKDRSDAADDKLTRDDDLTREREGGRVRKRERESERGGVERGSNSQWEMRTEEKNGGDGRQLQRILFSAKHSEFVRSNSRSSESSLKLFFSWGNLGENASRDFARAS